MPSKEEIKIWMEKNNVSRDRLAELCSIKRSHINNWFAKNGKIPKAKLALIESLMATQSNVNNAAIQECSLTINLKGDLLDRVEQLALDSGMSIREWVCSVVESSAPKKEE